MSNMKASRASSQVNIDCGPKVSKRRRKAKAQELDSLSGKIVGGAMPKASAVVFSESLDLKSVGIKKLRRKKLKRRAGLAVPLASSESLGHEGNENKKPLCKKLKRDDRLVAALAPSISMGSQSASVKKPRGKKLKRAASLEASRAKIESVAPQEPLDAKSLRPDSAKAKRIWREAVPSAPKLNGFHTFAVDPLDHAETDARAYEDISACLRIFAKQLGKTPGTLRLWDPYFCKGSVKVHLTKLGFPLTYNANEDFYAVIESGKLPPHDAVISSPPYSGNHLERCMKYVVESKKPWFLLLPNWVAQKDYFTSLMKKEIAQPFFLAPTKRYTYWMPVDLCKEGSSRPDWVKEDGGTSPYHTTWFVHLRSSNSQEAAFKALDSLKGPFSKNVVVGRSMNAVKWKVKKRFSKK